MKGLSQKQQLMLTFIQDYIKQHHYSPSYREIMQHFSFASPASIYKYIQILKRKGVLTGENRVSRSILPIDTKPDIKLTEAEVPFVGTLSLKGKMELFMQPQSLAVPASLVSNLNYTYALQTEGDFLNEEFICDGDFLLIEARDEPQDGERVLIKINQQELLIRHYYPEGQYIRLESASHQTLILNPTNITILGILVGLIRTY